MKIRQGFVSNSSSSSFVIKKEHLSNLQIFALLHLDDIKKMPSEAFVYVKNDTHTGWTIEDKGDKITGSTIMDNLCMHELFAEMGIDDNLAEWDE